MSSPNKCPVCNGTGLVSVPPGVAGDAQSFTSDSSGPWGCEACGGTGMVSVIPIELSGQNNYWQERCQKQERMLRRIQKTLTDLRTAEQHRDAALREIEAWLTDMERNKL